MRVHDDWLLTPQRAAVHLPTATAVVADLHLGYDLARRRSGEAVPALGVAATLSPLEEKLVAEHGVRRLVIAGDVVENVAGLPAVRELLVWLESRRIELIGVAPGNHDRRLEEIDGLPLCPQGVMVGDWRVLHGEGDLPRGRLVHGHFHPQLDWGRVRAACFLVGPRRLVLPALTPEARGVSVLNDPRWRRYRCAVIAGDRVLDFGTLGTFRQRLHQT